MLCNVGNSAIEPREPFDLSVDAAEQVVNLHDSLSHRQLDFSFLIRYTKQPGPNGGMSSRLRWILWERIDGLTL